MSAVRDRVETPKRGRVRFIGVVLLVGVAAVGLKLVTGTEPARNAEPVLRAGGAGVMAVSWRETRRTLDPARFVGGAPTAHQVACDIPDVLDQLYCDCQCDKHAGHKSRLSCYTDGCAVT